MELQRKWYLWCSSWSSRSAHVLSGEATSPRPAERAQGPSWHHHPSGPGAGGTWAGLCPFVPSTNGLRSLALLPAPRPGLCLLSPVLGLLRARLALGNVQAPFVGVLGGRSEGTCVYHLPWRPFGPFFRAVIKRYRALTLPAICLVILRVL